LKLFCFGTLLAIPDHDA